MKRIIQVVLSISSIQRREKNCYFTDFFTTRCQCENFQTMWREKLNIFCREVDVVKIKIWRMLQWNSCGQKLDVLFSIQGLRKLVKADSFAIFLFLDAKHLYTALPWFSFSLFYILLFSVHIDNANAAKSGTVFVNLSVNVYINNYIYIYDRVSVKF